LEFPSPTKRKRPKEAEGLLLTTKKSVKRKDIEKGLGSYKNNTTNYLQERSGR
jgi:hypothetical protein